MRSPLQVFSHRVLSVANSNAAILSGGGIATIVKTLQSTDAAVQTNASVALLNLASSCIHSILSLDLPLSEVLLVLARHHLLSVIFVLVFLLTSSLQHQHVASRFLQVLAPWVASSPSWTAPTRTLPPTLPTSSPNSPPMVHCHSRGFFHLFFLFPSLITCRGLRLTRMFRRNEKANRVARRD